MPWSHPGAMLPQMECPACEDVDLLADLPGRWLCPACGWGWRLDATTGRAVEDCDLGNPPGGVE